MVDVSFDKSQSIVCGSLTPLRHQLRSTKMIGVDVEKIGPIVWGPVVIHVVWKVVSEGLHRQYHYHNQSQYEKLGLLLF